MTNQTESLAELIASIEKKLVDVAEIAHRFGGFYESGAWRFPSPDRMQSFSLALQAAEDVARATSDTGPIASLTDTAQEKQ